MNGDIAESINIVAISLMRRIRANLLVHNLNIVLIEIKTSSLRERKWWKGFALYVRAYIK